MWKPQTHQPGTPLNVRSVLFIRSIPLFVGSVGQRTIAAMLMHRVSGNRLFLNQCSSLPLTAGRWLAWLAQFSVNRFLCQLTFPTRKDDCQWRRGSSATARDSRFHSQKQSEIYRLSFPSDDKQRHYVPGLLAERWPVRRITPLSTGLADYGCALPGPQNNLNNQ